MCFACAAGLPWLSGCSPGDDTSAGAADPDRAVVYLQANNREGTAAAAESYIQNTGGHQTYEQWREDRCLTESSPGVEYINDVDLGFGRRLKFAECAKRISACVENTPEGKYDIDAVHALNSPSRVAVCMDYWPPSDSPASGRPLGYEVQFFVFIDGESRDRIDIDGQKPKLSPFVCTACHGGAFVDSENLVQYGQFLPLRKESLIFTNYPPAWKEEVIHEMNKKVHLVAKTQGIREILDASYLPGGVNAQDATYYERKTPAGWLQHGDVYQVLIGEHCITCHAAQITYGFGSHAEFLELKERVYKRVCEDRDMPNSRQGREHFQEYLQWPARQMAGCE